MNNLAIIIPAIAITGVLFAVGGYTATPVRRYVIPLVLAGVAFYITHSWWCLTMLTAFGTFSLGYGDNSLFRKAGDGFGRGIWGVIVALTLSLGLFLTGHMVWYGFLIYIVLGGILEPWCKNLYQVAGDIIIGIGFGSLLLFIH